MFLPELLRGAEVTVKVLLLSAVLAFCIAFVAGFGRLSRFAVVRFITAVFVELFRGTSLLVQMFFFFFALPAFGIELSPFTAGVIALGLNYGAYASEIVRGAILAIPHGQTEAGIALNMTRWQRMRLVILPQAIRIMLPGFGNNLIELLKGTSLVSLITLADLTFQARVLKDNYVGNQVEIFTLLLLMYFVIALPLIFLSRWLEKKASKGVAVQ
ncbi:MAG: ectoine/hydroxyectoine ABC transporter permease subunit EhuC [Novibacillus thermophilus]|jgi:polar amino acid transport system permease protein|uniref:Ectoine/hydroxyectoine ABC transporter permease subunit EhuC n=1 Tax=Novibacillus thermophilus TaxID=1471761 RepID=A0A1U9K9V0_9BACL|nr:ectoine/hydroxyectoine ABC transporter permease subunit EhuC [Novibacillus thermophilus]AQS56791.1 ectoine/hydroxyectoine ABC transporter permease subunit EhuC [Novibacillus thermophilus]